MKIILPLLVCLFLSGCANWFNVTEEKTEMKLAAGTAEGMEPPKVAFKKRILIAPFLNRSRNGGDEIKNHATQVTREILANSNEFILVPLEEISGHERFVNEFNEYNIPVMFEAARNHSINGIVAGIIQDLSIRETGDETGLFRSREFAVTATVRVSILDTSTEREVYSKLTSADVTEQHVDLFNDRKVTSFDPDRGKVAVSKALEKLSTVLPNYARKVAWTGRIAKVDLHRYYINAGETSGIARGQLLKVYDEGQHIYDPETKSLLGIAPGRFKGLLKVVDHFGSDGSIAVIHSGGGFREKDRVEIFTSLQN